MYKWRSFLTVAEIATFIMWVSIPAQAQYYTVNGPNLTYQELQYLAALGIPPGAYLMDARGNMCPSSEPEATIRAANHGDPLPDPRAVIDPTGGCEGGSCINFGPGYR